MNRKSPLCKQLVSIPSSVLLGILCIMMLIRGEAVRLGAFNGLLSCGQIIIPSLYLFMAVSGLIAHSSAGEMLARPLAPLTRYVFRLPSCMGPTIVLSCIGGYPLGAKNIADLLDEGRISQKDAERALCFCCNAGPSFVVTAIGTGGLGSTRSGIILLFAHLFSALLIGTLLSIRKSVPEKESARRTALSFPEALITGVNNATTGIFSICAFVIFFSAFGALLDASGLSSLPNGKVIRCIILGLLEVTTGCMEAASLPGQWPILLIPVFLSFAGCSILFQIRAILADYKLHFGRFFLCRILHAGMTLSIFYPMLLKTESPVGAFASESIPVACHTPNTPVITLLLLLTSAYVLLHISNNGNQTDG